jgi:hypothetical protein
VTKVTTPKQTTAQKTAAQNKKAAAMLKTLLSKMDSDIFDRLCGEGRDLVLEAAKIANVDPSNFVGSTTVQLQFGAFELDLPAGYNGSPDDYADYKVDITVTHSPTKTKVVRTNWDIDYIEIQ